METLTLESPAMSFDTDAPDEFGSTFAPAQDHTRRLDDASEKVIGNALRKIDIAGFLEMSELLTGGQ